tara:strand:- start:81 stop:467 length:387 start_codon:yes stop_codon:yes gene_type:complete
MTEKVSNWFPEIMYEESQEGVSSQIPFIMVPLGEDMPRMLFIFESRASGNYEPGLEGEEVPVYEWDLHQYADMAVLKDKLSPSIYDIVRGALGLEPLGVAAAKGSAITGRVRNNLEAETTEQEHIKVD